MLWIVGWIPAKVAAHTIKLVCPRLRKARITKESDNTMAKRKNHTQWFRKHYTETNIDWAWRKLELKAPANAYMDLCQEMSLSEFVIKSLTVL